MNSIIHKYDQLNKKGFDDRNIYGELEGAIKDQTSYDFYEYIAFLLAEYLPDRRPWGCLFGYRCAIGMSDGSFIEHPQINVITPEMVLYWEQRRSDAVNPILKQRYSALVLELKKRICGIKPDYHLRQQNVELIKTLIEEEYIIDECQIATKLQYAFELLPSIHDESLLRSFISTISNYLDTCPDKGWAIDNCLDILLEKERLFKVEEKELWISVVEKKVEHARKHHMVDAWRTLSHIKRLLNLSKDNKDKLLLYIDETITDFRICCADNEMMLYGNLESIRNLCMKYNLKEKAKDLLLEMQRLAKSFGKFMSAHVIHLPYSEKRAKRIMELCMNDDPKEALSAFVTNFIPTRGEAEDYAELEKNSSPLMAMISSQQLDQDYHPLSSTGGIEKDEEGKVIEKYKLLLMADENLLHNVIAKNTKRGIFSVSSIMTNVSDCVAFKGSRYGIIEKGVKAYFGGDYIIALHLLIPQIENAIRLIYEQNGGLVIKGHKYGKQLENLDNVLKSDQIKTCFSEDGAFYLKNLLSDMRSMNLRNSICHGLMEETEMEWNVADRILHALLFVCSTKMKRCE